MPTQRRKEEEQAVLPEEQPIITKTEGIQILSAIKRLEGVIFAGQVMQGFGPEMDCSCQNCGCDGRTGDNCGCNPKCSCQGYTAQDWGLGQEYMFEPLLGVASVLPINDIETLVGLRDKTRELRKKRTRKE